VRFDKLEPVIRAFTDRDVFTAGFFMLGFPSESEAELNSTIDFAIASSLHAAFFFVVTPFQGTELHGQVSEQIGPERTRSFTRLFARQKVNLSDVSDGRFFAIRRRAFLRFYLDPRRTLSTLRALPQPLHLAHLAFIMLFRDTLRLEPGRLLGPLVRLSARLRGHAGLGASMRANASGSAISSSAIRASLTRTSSRPTPAPKSSPSLRRATVA
jgi:hypothetical protein